MKLEMTPTMQLQEPDDLPTEIIGKKRVSTTPLRQEPDWKRIAERLYRDLDAIELMSDSTLPSYPGLDRLEQIHYTARSATELFMLSTMEKT